MSNVFQSTGRKNRHRLSLAAFLLATSAYSTPAFAAENGDEEAEGGQEIIVTATRREAALSDIPMAINAFDGTQLAERGVSNIEDLQTLVAGLDVSNQTGEIKIALRGIGGSAQYNVGSESAVAVHRDGVFLARRQDQGLSFYDVERVEVLRGPQGTLYGRNATGGAVNIITASPTSDLRFGLSTTYGSQDSIQAEGFVSGPIAGDKLSGRIAVFTQRNDGYTPNIYDGRRYDNEDAFAGRVKLLFEPSATLSFELGADYGVDKGIPVLVYSRGRNGAPLAGELQGSILPSGRAINNDSPFKNRKEAWGVNARSNLDLGNAQLTTLVAYRELDYLRYFDADGSSVPILINDLETRTGNQFSSEITLSSTGSGPLEWVAGLFNFQSSEESYTRFLLVPINIAAEQVIPDLKTDAYAAFAEATYALSDRVGLTLGGRFSHEKKSIDEYSQARDLDLNLLGPAVTNALSKSWDSFTPKAALTFEIDPDANVYATVSRGFKAGGFNGGQIQRSAYDPETVTNYELGAKLAPFGGRAHLNIAAFYMDYKDLQAESTTTSDTGTTIFVVQNAASATIKGIEVEFDARLSDAFSIEGNVNYLDAKFGDFPNAIDASIGNAVVDVSGNRMANAPEWVANLAATYETPVSDELVFKLRGEWGYRSRTYFTFFEDPLRSQEAYSLFNARVSLEAPDGHWSASAFVRNIGDELVANQRQLSGNALSGRPLFSAYLPPRTYGLTFSYKY